MSSRRKVLLIDYDPESIESTRGPLLKAGYEVEVVNDGIAGIEAFERFNPDLVLIEPMVPKKHGFQVCQEIKSTAAGRDTPVLITTGFYRGRQHRAEAHENYGCDAYLEKPIAEDLLLSTCGKFLIDTQEPPIPVADEPVVPLPPAPLPPVRDSGPVQVDRLPDIPIPGDERPSNLQALDDLTEDEIQQRLDAMIIGEESPPATGPPAADPIEALETAATSPVEPAPVIPAPSAPEVANPVEVDPVSVSPAAPAPPADVPVVETPPESLAPDPPTASPTVEAPTDRAPDATVESLLSRRSAQSTERATSSESAAEGEPEVAPFVSRETPGRSRLPLWIGVAAGVFIVVGITMLWMLRDRGAGDSSVEVASMSVGEARQTPSRSPTSIPPATVPFESADTVGGAAPDAAVDQVVSVDDVDDVDDGAGEIVAAIEPPPLKTTPPVTTPSVASQPSSRPAVASVENGQRSAAPAAALTAEVTADSAAAAKDTIDDRAPTPPASRAKPEPEPEAVPAELLTRSSTPAGVNLAPVPVTVPETETVGNVPLEPLVPMVRRGDVVDLADLDQVPVVKAKPMPDYPTAAQSMRLEGTVNMRLLVDDHGKVERVEIDSGTKSKLLQRSAASAAERWLYEPGVKNGVPVKVWVTASVNFEL